MAFFRNDAVNRLNLHTTIQSLAVGAGGLFFLAFLLRAGVSIPATLLAQAAILAGRFVIRPLVLPLGVRFGLKPVIIAGALVKAAQYPLLAEVKGLDAWLAAVCIVAAAGDALYWPSYHAQFASLGDAEHRGHQVSAREAAASLVNIVAPLIGAFALTTLGPRLAFGAVAVVQALSVAPLLGAPNVAIAPRVTEPYRAVRLGLALIVSDGWFTATYWIVWQIALFVSLGRSIGAFGGAMALAQLAGAAIGLLLGRHIDKGGGARAAVLAYGIAIMVVLAMAMVLSVGSPWLAVGASVASAFVGASVTPTIAAAFYNLGKASPCALRWAIITEGGFDVGCAAGALVAAAIAAAGASLAWALLLALPAATLSMALLRRYYRTNPPADASEAPHRPLEARVPDVTAA